MKELQPIEKEQILNILKRMELEDLIIQVCEIYKEDELI